MEYQEPLKYKFWPLLAGAIIGGLIVWFLTAPLRQNLKPTSGKTEQLQETIKNKNDSITGGIKTASDISKNSAEKSKDIINRLPVDKPVIKDATNEYMKDYLRNYKPE